MAQWGRNHTRDPLEFSQFKRTTMTFAIQPTAFGDLDSHGAEFFSDLDSARDAAFDWSVGEHGAPITVWRLTTGKAIRWMEVVA